MRMSYSNISSQHQRRTTAAVKYVRQLAEMFALRWSRVGIDVWRVLR